MGGTTPQGAPWWVMLPTCFPSGTFLAHMVSSGPEKITVKFHRVWTSFGIDFLKSQNKQKKLELALGTGLIG